MRETNCVESANVAFSNDVDDSLELDIHYQGLLDRFVDGDASAFEALYAQHHNYLHQSASAFVRSNPLSKIDPDQLTQETWLKIFSNAHTYESSKAQFLTWANTILKNTGRDMLRSQLHGHDYRYQSLDTIDPTFFDFKSVDSVTPEKLAVMDDLVNQALSILPADLQKALLIRYYEERTIPEVQKALGDDSPNTTRSRLARSRQKVQAHLGEIVDTDSQGRIYELPEWVFENM